MVNYNLPLYQNAPEIWNKAKCKKMANHIASDGLDTKYPFKGYIGSTQIGGYGEQRYNGGCIRNGEWYQGENNPLPIIDEEFEIVHIANWGYQIRAR